MALVYFADHGVEVNGRNYLVPVDAGFKDAGDVEYEAVSLDQVRSAIARAAKLRDQVNKGGMCVDKPPLKVGNGNQRRRR